MQDRGGGSIFSVEAAEARRGLGGTLGDYEDSQDTLESQGGGGGWGAGCAAACARREAAAATLLAVAVVALPPVLAEAAAAAAFLALAAQPPVLAAAAYLAPHWPQTMRARCATNSQRTKRLVPIDERAESRSQIPREKSGTTVFISLGRRKKLGKTGKSPNRFLSHVENSVPALLQISVQRRRSQIAQITSHRRCAREKQKSGAAVDMWRFADSCKGDPIFSETRDLRILSALADPHFALPEFCRAGSMPSRSRTSRNLD